MGFGVWGLGFGVWVWDLRGYVGGLWGLLRYLGSLLLPHKPGCLRGLRRVLGGSWRFLCVFKGFQVLGGFSQSAFVSLWIVLRFVSLLLFLWGWFS